MITNTKIPADIVAACVRATSFPQGVGAAFQTLHGLLPSQPGRVTYGISYPQDGDILYRAATTQLHPGEAAEKGLEEFTIRAGDYACITLDNYMQNPQAIGEAFNKLTDLPQIDPHGYCLEIYETDSRVQCMVPLTK